MHGKRRREQRADTGGTSRQMREQRYPIRALAWLRNAQKRAPTGCRVRCRAVSLFVRRDIVRARQVDEERREQRGLGPAQD